MPWSPSTLKRIRERRGLTQQQLAERAGAHRITIVKLESGALRPGVDLLEAVARALKVKVNDLLKPTRAEVTR